jgi:hypothetical protein
MIVLLRGTLNAQRLMLNSKFLEFKDNTGDKNTMVSQNIMQIKKRMSIIKTSSHGVRR